MERQAKKELESIRGYIRREWEKDEKGREELTTDEVIGILSDPNSRRNVGALRRGIELLRKKDTTPEQKKELRKLIDEDYLNTCILIANESTQYRQLLKINQLAVELTNGKYCLSLSVVAREISDFIKYLYDIEAASSLFDGGIRGVLETHAKGTKVDEKALNESIVSIVKEYINFRAFSMDKKIFKRIEEYPFTSINWEHIKKDFLKENTENTIYSYNFLNSGIYALCRDLVELDLWSLLSYQMREDLYETVKYIESRTDKEKICTILERLYTLQKTSNEIAKGKIDPSREIEYFKKIAKDLDKVYNQIDESKVKKILLRFDELKKTITV